MVKNKLKTSSSSGRIKTILSDVGTYLKMHGGDVKLLEITPDGVAKIELQGACVGCSAADTTMEFLLKEAILTQCPEIIDVEAINMAPIDHAPPGIRL